MSDKIWLNINFVYVRFKYLVLSDVEYLNLDMNISKYF